MLMAVEMWMKRDHDAEWKAWQSWIDHIATRVKAVDGVTTSVDTARLALEPDARPADPLGPEAPRRQRRRGRAAALRHRAARRRSSPRRGRMQPGETGLTIGPYMMAAGDEKVVADRLYAILSKPERTEEKTPAAATVDLTGTWDVRIEYAASSSSHRLHLRQRGNDVEGQHQGDFVARDLSGTVDGDAVRLRSDFPESNGDALGYTFTGTRERRRDGRRRWTSAST